ncbi:MAG: hypothetical protein R6X33_11325 [Candidatus Brocadiia bacterium]
MAKIVRYRYVGSALDAIYILLACITVVFIPIAVMHMLQTHVRIEEEVARPDEIVAKLRRGKIGGEAG